MVDGAVGEDVVLLEMQREPQRAGRREGNALAKHDRELQELEAVDSADRQERLEGALSAEQERVPGDSAGAARDTRVT